MFHHFAHLPNCFSQIPICQSRIDQKLEHPKLESIQPRSQTSLQGIRPLEIGSDFAINDKRRTFSSKEERHLKAHYSILVTVLSKMIRFDFQNRKLEISNFVYFSYHIVCNSIRNMCIPNKRSFYVAKKMLEGYSNKDST